MRVVHLVRKPLSSTVVPNVLEHGAGVINIDLSRVRPSSGGSISGGSISGSTALGQGSGWNAHHNRTTQIDRSMSAGRWPSNLILQHLEGCRCLGTTRVKGTSIHGEATAIRRSGVHSSVGGHQTIGREQPVRGFSDADGMEEIAAWECDEGCPIAALDRQVGHLHGRGNRKPTTGGGGLYGHSVIAWDSGPMDAGGASRFFKQVKG